jgi:hypothetical protein
VSDFDFQFVQVTANLYLETGFAEEGARKKIIHALDIFLSPWIASNESQIAIDEPITDAQVADFINDIEGVAGVESVSFLTWSIDPQTGQQKKTGPGEQTITPMTESTLFVSGMNHVIEFIK